MLGAKEMEKLGIGTHKMADFLKLFGQFYNSQLSPCHQLVPVKDGDR